MSGQAGERRGASGTSGPPSPAPRDGSTPVPSAPLALPEAHTALAALLDRVAATRAQVGDRFPLFADPDTGRWTTSRRGSWTGGFWAGLLWLRARLTGDPADRTAAVACTARLAAMVEADTATRGLIFWYGTALADDDASAALRERAALACRDAYDPALGLVPWGSAFGGERLLARADGVPGLVPLLATVDPEAARSHLRRHLELCLAERPFRWSLRHGPRAGWTACADPPPGWSRGPAWLLLAVADAVRHAQEQPDTRPGAGELLSVAALLVPPVHVPPADDARPGGPLDTSAAALSALALLKFGRHDRAAALLRRLVRDHLTGDGRLLDGCYDLGSGTAVRHELIWGDFFLACALAVLTGALGAHAL
ncbi:sugar ABC transporter permease [Streptomyces sp. NPDC002564]|uniref:sugar ABC transporter permease n=1 Tax=Streptomyces sp. NPDC002564 TaxID=3364649 RepID=UPI0036AD5421